MAYYRMIIILVVFHILPKTTYSFSVITHIIIYRYLYHYHIISGIPFPDLVQRQRHSLRGRSGVLSHIQPDHLHHQRRKRTEQHAAAGGDHAP